MKKPPDPPKWIARITQAAGCATGLGAAGMAATWLCQGPARFWGNWIVGFLYLDTLALGCLLLVALEHLVGAKWSVPLRRVPERLSSLLLLGGPASLIGLGALPTLFPGSRPEALHDPLLAGKAFWLGLAGYGFRTLLCVVLALGGWAILVGGSLRQDHTRNPRFTVRARRFAPAFMMLFALVLTALAFDWISALTPAWYSDVLGVYLFSGTFLAGLSASTLIVLHLRDGGRLPGVCPDHLYSLGGFLFAFTVFWAYIAFAQYLLMWYGNLPVEAAWFRVRLQGAWYVASFALVLLHFLFPFAILLSRSAKQDPRRLRWVAWTLLAAHLLDLQWLVLPALGTGVHYGWPEWSFALFFLGGALLWVRVSLTWGHDMPVGDPFLAQGLAFRL